MPDAARFLRSWAERPLQIGAVQPSGRALARTMASYVDPALSGPVIEIGPGTGPVTAALFGAASRPSASCFSSSARSSARFFASAIPGAGDRGRCLSDREDARAASPRAGSGRRLEPAAAHPPGGGASRSLAAMFRDDGAERAFHAIHLCDDGADTGGGARLSRPRRRAASGSNVPPARVWVYRRLAA